MDHQDLLDRQAPLGHLDLQGLQALLEYRASLESQDQMQWALQDPLGHQVPKGHQEIKDPLVLQKRPPLKRLRPLSSICRARAQPYK